MIETPRSLDFSLILRGFFATAVVWWHTDGYRLDATGLDAFNTSGRLAVWMFFGLSGYVIGYGFFKPRYELSTQGVACYLLRRALRILPLFWLATAITISILYMQGRSFDVGLSQLLAFQWQHLDYPVGVFWTLGVELQFYLSVPLLAWAMIATGRWSIAVGVGLWLALWLSFGDSPDDRSMIGNLQHFIAGMLIAKAYLSGSLDRFQRPWWMVLFACLGMAAICTANLLYHAGQFWTLRASLASDVAIIALLVVNCALAERALAPRLAGRLLMGLGVVAYGLYAWHGVLLTLWPGMGDSFLILFVSSLAVAIVSFVFFERPAMDVGRTAAHHGLTTKL